MLQDGNRLPDVAVRAGCLKLREDAGRREDSEENKAILEKLQLEEAAAKSESRGVWLANGKKIETTYDIPDAKSYAEQWKGKPIDGIVERVFTGDRMILRLLESPTKHVQTMVLVAGVRAPTTKRTNPSDGKEQPAEPFGNEAHQFVETRLLQRNVKVDILGASPQNQLVCSVIHPNGSIAKFLLEAGLARCVDHHSTMLGGEMATLRKAEVSAKNANKGLFQDHVASKDTAGDVDATVTRVQTADTIYVRSKGGAEKRVSLSSIRQPKPTDPKQSPFQAEAKEFLRKRLIGKHVKISVDGKKAASEGYEEREVATVIANQKNVALGLVEAGYASVIRHRRDDDDRSPHYDALLAAEETAQKEQKGMWNPTPPAAKHYVDYSESLQKAKIQSSVLQRQKRIPAVVDFVKSGSRFTLLIPRENAKLTFVLSGIRAPRSARNPNEASEPFGQEAHDFANRRCMQRDVEVDVEGTDKIGGFIGALYINRENFAKLLLEEGLANVHGYSAEQSGFATEYFAAEKKAKDAKKGQWHDWDPSKDDPDVEETNTNGDKDVDAATDALNGTSLNGSAAPAKKTFRDIMITHIDRDTLNLKVQLTTPKSTQALAALSSALQQHHNATPAPPALPSASLPPKVGSYVSARFSEDKAWYRARVRRNDREAKTSEVLYIDYGNSEALPWTTLRALPEKWSPVTGSLPPQARDASLSFVRPPRQGTEYVADAWAWLSERVLEREMAGIVDFEDAKDQGRLWVTVFGRESLEGGGVEDSVNRELVEEGLAVAVTAKKARGLWEKRGLETKDGVIKGIQVGEEKAREERRGVWEYGDLGEDDE